MGASGFLLAAAIFKVMPVGKFLALLGGMALVIASACVFNNYIDTNIDRKMSRTKKRALVTHKISRPAALIYAVALGTAGFAVLALFTNSRVVWLNLAAIFSYVVLYGWAKRNSVHGTLVGTVPGAIPPVAGYAAVAPFDKAALLLFLVLVFWQMAHFYAIALFRENDYRSAGLPVMPIKYGGRITRIQIIAYVIALALALALLVTAGFEGWFFLVVSLVLCIYWLYKGWSGYSLSDETWGKRMFLASLIVLVGLSALIPIGALLA